MVHILCTTLEAQTENVGNDLRNYEKGKNYKLCTVNFNFGEIDNYQYIQKNDILAGQV